MSSSDVLRELIQVWQQPFFGDTQEQCRSRQTEAISAVVQKAREVLRSSEDRAYKLAVAIMGGEDAPGYADSVPTQELVDLIRRERILRDEIDYYNERQIARLKGLLGRYAKHTAYTAAPVQQDENFDARMAFPETSPWVTWEELQEIQSYADRPV